MFSVENYIYIYIYNYIYLFSFGRGFGDSLSMLFPEVPTSRG